MRIFNRSPGNSTARDRDQSFDAQASSLIPAEVRLISGCHSEQTSADVAEASCIAKLPNPAGRSGGACTLALLDILYAAKADRKLTFQDLLLRLRESLASKGLSQIPQLTSSRPLELKETAFSLRNGPGQCRALLVGINYSGQSGELRGCHNDIINTRQYLIDRQGYNPSNILVLMDDGKHIFPTRQKVILGLQQLVAHSRPGDNVYFHFSGHGGLLSPEGFNSFKLTQKEYEETLFPLDHERAGQIRDFSLFQHFVKPMAAGVTVTAVLDCCHSGSVLDLPYSFKPTPGGQIRMQKSFDSLSNLAFLYILAGGFLPGGFGNVADHLSDVLGQPVDGFHGAGATEMENTDLMDDSAVQQSSEYIPTTGVDGLDEISQRDPGDIDPGSEADAGPTDGIEVDDGINVVRTMDEPYVNSGVSDDLGSNDLANIPPLTYGNYQTYDDGYNMPEYGDGSVPTDSNCDCGEGLVDIFSSLLDSEQ